MANSPSPKKKRLAYLEYKEVYNVLKEIASEQGITPTEVIREAVLKRANAELKKRGKPPLKLDPSSDAHLEG